MINQKLQDFEEEVKPLGDIMTQVNDSSRKNTIYQAYWSGLSERRKALSTTFILNNRQISIMHECEAVLSLLCPSPFVYKRFLPCFYIFYYVPFFSRPPLMCITRL